MNERSQPKKITQFRISPERAQEQIRKLAAASGNIKWSRHALQRMEERGFDDIDVLRALRTGSIFGIPEPTEDPGWKCKMVRAIRGGRDIGVVTIIIRSTHLLIKTVEWEDLK